MKIIGQSVNWKIVFDMVIGNNNAKKKNNDNNGDDDEDDDDVKSNDINGIKAAMATQNGTRKRLP